MIHRTPTLRLTACALLLAAPFAAALAAERVVKNYSYDLNGIEHIDIRGAVGSVTVIHTDTPTVKVELEIRQQEEGWFADEVELDQIELDGDVRGDRLVLRQTDKDINVEWTIELPTVAETSIEFGVGSIEGEFGDTALKVDLGVGDVDLTLPTGSVGRVALSVGVGDARLRGATRDYEERSFVSQEVKGSGEGDNDVVVEVGVGDIHVDLDALGV